MWEWIKRWLITGKPSQPPTPSALEVAFSLQSAAMADLMKRQQDLLEQQQTTLDRIVTAKYDRPISLPSHAVPNEQMSAWALNDQGDTQAPPPMGLDMPVQLPPNMAAVLDMDSDEDFLRAVGAE